MVSAAALAGGSLRGMRTPSSASTIRALHVRENAHRADEKQRERNADDEQRKADSEADAGHRPNEIENPRCQRHQHVHQRAVGAWVTNDAEEAALLVRCGCCLGEGAGDARFHGPVFFGDFLRCSIGLDDARQYCRLRSSRVRRDLALQMLRGIGQRIGNQAG